MLPWLLTVAAFSAFAPPPPASNAQCTGSYWIVGDKAAQLAESFISTGGIYRKLLERRRLPTNEFCLHVLDPEERTQRSLYEVYERLGMGGATDGAFVYNNAFPVTWQTRGSGNEEDGRVNLTDGTTARGVSLPLLMSKTVPTRKEKEDFTSLLSISGGLADVASVGLQLVDSGLFCSRVDFLEVVVTGAATCSSTSLSLPGSAPGFSTAGNVGFAGPELLRALTRLKGDPDCRLSEFSLDDRDGAISEQLVVQSSPELGTKLFMEKVLYAVGADPDHLASRLPLVLNSWTTTVPERKLAVFTEKRSNLTVRGKPPRGVPLVQMKIPSREDNNSSDAKRTDWRESGRLDEWSVFERIKLMWDKVFLKDDDAGWLVLVDDVTFVFGENLARTLARFNHHDNLIFGSLEQPRVDLLGDFGMSPVSGTLREMSRSNCSLESGDCQSTFCTTCPGVAAPGMVVLSRGLVQSLRKHLEECEKTLRPQGRAEEAKDRTVENLAHAKLYGCIVSFTNDTEQPRFIELPGIHQRPWRGETDRTVAHDVVPLSYTGFERGGGVDSSTGSIAGDFAELMELKAAVQGRHSQVGGPGFVSEQDVADQIGCLGLRRWTGVGCERLAPRSPSNLTEIRVY